MKKTLFLIRGLPGSGKSFAAAVLSENGKYPVLSADMYFEDSEGNYNWDASKIKDAHAWCRNSVEEEMLYSMVPEPDRFLSISNRDCSKIFVANTFTEEWEMQPYFDLAKQYGYNVVTLICENRHGGQNVHDVPEETLVKMKNRFQIKL